VPVWIVLEVFLGLAQVINGGSLNGIWWWLGERRFTYGGIGIAQIRLFDEGWIRAYGTFSHPNSLAGFLLLSWWWWKKEIRDPPRRAGKILDFRKIFYWIVNWSAVFGIILTGSRVVWALGLGMIVFEQLHIKNFRKLIKRADFKKKMLGNIFLGGGIICLVLGIISIDYRVSDFVGGWDVNSWKKREMLGMASIRMIKKYPLFGVGAGNFVVNLSKFQSGSFYWMQPVHNIFLLIWNEIGVLGVILGLVFGANKLIGFKWKKYIWLLIIVWVTGMFDHYWLTLPQNAWLLAIILGVI
jgi:hypothetical protein